MSTLRWTEVPPEEPPIGPEKPLSCVDGWESHTWTLNIEEGGAGVSTNECRLCDDGASLDLFPEYLNGSFPVTLSLHVERYGRWGEEADAWWLATPTAHAKVERMRAAGDALAAPGTATDEPDQRDRGSAAMKQTSIIVRVGNEEVLVRIVGQHVPADQIKADIRDARVWDTWQPVEAEVRNEGDDV